MRLTDTAAACCGRSTISSTQRIRDAFDRMQHVFAKRPAVAQATATMRARSIDGLHRKAREGDFPLSLDLPVDAGGTDAGAAPGVHGRAALASCLAMSHSVELVRAAIEARSIEVEVQLDYDNRGRLGLDNTKPLYLLGCSAGDPRRFMRCAGRAQRAEAAGIARRHRGGGPAAHTARAT